MMFKLLVTTLLFFLFIGCSDADNSSDVETTPPIEQPVEAKPSNWYVRFVAEDSARGLKNQTTQVGAMDGVAVAQRHSLKSFAPKLFASQA